jgi:anti-sigma B factor antagonist
MDRIKEIQDGIKVFHLRGRLDSNTAQKLEDDLFRAISGGSNKIIVDFENLDYISSAGVRLFLEAYHALLSKDGQIILCSMQQHIREIFQAAGVDDLVLIFDNMNQAIEAF